ncbi:MAG: hypothetical protein KDC84_13020 [Crocinitomicaceae bacterium]|nr:hypothetical protein [Crocinitomicaceae bacterium]
MKSKKSEGYLINGQSKSGYFEPGEVYEMSFIAYADMDYKISVGADVEDKNGQIEFELYEKKNKQVKDGNTIRYEKVDKILFKNKDNEMTQSFEFQSGATRRIYVRVQVPKVDGGDGAAESYVCVGVLLEHQRGVKTGFGN